MAFACNNDNKRSEVEQIIREWTGKEVFLPSDVDQFSLSGNDSISNIKPFKILNFTDSTGCTSCKLKLGVWNIFIAEADSTFGDKVDFLFYFHPQNERELKFMLRSERFKHPAFIDIHNKIDSLNHFPRNPSYQCFLLDGDNKVVLVGNPTVNPQLWELYKEIITGNKSSKQPVTEIFVEKDWVQVEGLKLDKTKQVIFTVENRGPNPLLLTNIDSSCGCTKPTWDRKPVKSGEKIHITVDVTPDSKGLFDKTLQVFCNTDKGKTTLRISGMVE